MYRLVVIALLAVGSSYFIQQIEGGCDGYTVMLAPPVVTATFQSEHFPSPYEDYTFCRWNISGPTDKRLRVTFETNFNVEQSSTCNSDYVAIYDLARPGLLASLDSKAVCARTAQNAPASPPSNGPLCGTTPPPSFTTKGNTAVVEFCTDYAVTGAGWKMTWTLVDEPVLPVWQVPTFQLAQLTDKRLINSPNYPANYHDSYTAEYILRNQRPDRAIQLKALGFNIGITGCVDKLIVFDVTNNKSSTYCSTTPLTNLEIRNSVEVRLTFTSDAWDSFKGFSIEASLLACPTNMLACDNNEGCYNGTSGCDGIPHCADGSDEKVEYCAPECGLSHFPIRRDNGKIVGGVTTNKHSLPWQAAMLQNGRQFCGGTIISDQWILSAAHCFTSIGSGTPVGYEALVGGHSLTQKANEAGVSIPFLRVFCHPYYAQPTTIRFDFDYCLVKLARKIPFRKNIVPACLPKQGGDAAPGTVCMISGWGDTSGFIPSKEEVEQETNFDLATKASADQLQQVFVPVVNRTVCNVAYNGGITDRMICSGAEEGGINPCRGDSGGPFVCENPAGRWLVHGIVSWGPGMCATPTSPAVFARTGSVIHWIANTISSNL